MGLSAILSHPACYHYLRQLMTGGLPFREWTRLYGLTDPNERVADIGCGPADILRYVNRGERPAFYLGLDISDRYLDAARGRAKRAGIDADFLRLDLDRLPFDSAVQEQLVDALDRAQATRVLLLGVIHHIDDAAAATTLSLVHRAPTVRALVTQDVVMLPGPSLNNYLAARDRGQHVRDEAGYDALASSSPWASHEKHWTRPNLPSVRYLHYVFKK